MCRLSYQSKGIGSISQIIRSFAVADLRRLLLPICRIHQSGEEALEKHNGL